MLWVQCAYSPPYVADYYDEEEEPEDDDAPDVAAGSEDESLAGAWNCAESPPKLW